jgi:hypothetical protein
MIPVEPTTRRRAQPTRRALAFLTVLALAGCADATAVQLAALGLFDDRAAPRTQPLATLPGPVARPARPLGNSFAARDLLTGATLRFDVAAEGRAAGRRVRVRQSDGCTWSRVGDWFAPSAVWSRCDDSRHWHSGRAEVRETASIWPLRPGAEGRWTRTATSHTGQSYTRETVCRVTGAAAVVRDGRAPTPAHVVVCRDGKRTRTTWFAPGEGPVAFRKVHDEHGVEEAWVRR